jgi:hypothetical protein
MLENNILICKSDDKSKRGKKKEKQMESQTVKYILNGDN